MNLHFTYRPSEEWKDSADLCQGDVLRRTDQLEDVLKLVHPHYFEKSSYRYFLVLTQSCDLVQWDGGPCKARYITIAAIRPLADAIIRAIEDVQYIGVERQLGFVSERNFQKVEYFLARLFNNNQDDYFFLRGQPDAGMPEDGCAFLQLSIALRAHEHYETLRQAKLLQLKDSFQHKLGYLVSKLYGRVGTEDWVPKTVSQQEFDRRIRERLKQGEYVIRLPDEIHRRVVKRLTDLDEPARSLEKFREIVEEEQRAKDKRTREAVDVIAAVLQTQGVSPEIIEQARTALNGNSTFRQCLK